MLNGDGVFAHVAASDPPLGWSLDPPLLLALALAALTWSWMVWRVNRAHPRSPVPAWRTAALLAGLAVLLVALQSPIDTHADDSFAVHMVQHLLLSFVAAPLLVLGAPMTVLLRFARPAVRRRLLLPLLHGRLLRALLFPPLTWALFAVAMWAAHFTPLFELSLESEPVHELEHLLFLATGLLYWLPAIGSEPVPWRLGWSMRLLYLFVGMPQSSVLGLVIYAQGAVLYPHYAVLLGGAALEDQRLAGTLMWVGSDLLSMVAIGLLVWAWARAEARPRHALVRRTS
jgi:cytochrome c oxidase assembly factor CtaG